MGINGLGQLNRVNLQKIMQQRGTQVRHVSAQNINMTKDGSIFNIRPNSNRANNSSSVRGNQKEKYTVDDGKRAISGAQSQAASARAGTTQAQQGTKQVNSIQDESSSLARTTKKSESALKKTMLRSQREVELNNKEMAKMAREIEQENTRMATFASQIESITAEQQAQSSFFGDGDPGGSMITGGSSAGRTISSLGAQMNDSSAKIAKYTSKVNKIQVSNNRSIRTMSHTCKVYISTVNKTQKTLDANQSTADKVMNVANKVGEISQYTSTTGQGVQLVGKGMRALGQAMAASVYPATVAVGTALISASVPVEATGSTVETIGNYGSTAASVTKSACSIANGDIAGALTNAGAAVMTGMSAAKGTQQMAKGFEGIKEQATQAMQQGLEKGAAKQLAKSNMENLQEAGFSKDQINQMSMNQTRGTLDGATMKEMRQGVKTARKTGGNNPLMNDALTQGQSNINKAETAFNAAQSDLAAKGVTGDELEKGLTSARESAVKGTEKPVPANGAEAAQGGAAGTEGADAAKKAKKEKANGDFMAFAGKIAGALNTAGAMYAQFNPEQAVEQSTVISQRTEEILANYRQLHNRIYS